MENKNPDKRAKELNDKIKDDFKKRKITIAVGNTDDFSLVGTSEKYMQNDVLNAMNKTEIVATPNHNKHAEEDIITEAEKREVKVTDIGASRPICIDCEEIIKENDITSHTEFSGKKSKNRRKYL